MTQPVLSVTHGRPDDEELAAVAVALLLVLAARARSAPRRPPRRPGWTRDRYQPPAAWSA